MAEQANPLVLPDRRELYAASRYSAFDRAFWLVFIAGVGLTVAVLVGAVPAALALAAVVVLLGVLKLGEFSHTAARERGMAQGRADMELVLQWLDQHAKQIEQRLAALEQRAV